MVLIIQKKVIFIRKKIYESKSIEIFELIDIKKHNSNIKTIKLIIQIK